MSARRLLAVCLAVGTLAAGSYLVVGTDAAITDYPDIRLVSHRADGGYPNAETIEAKSMSSDGRYVLFSTLASDVVANDTNGKSDVFVSDVVSGTVTRISTSGGGTAAAMTPDGLLVAWRSSTGAFYSTNRTTLRSTTLRLPTGSFVRRMSDDGRWFLVSVNRPIQPNSITPVDYYLVDGKYGTKRLVDARPDGKPALNGASSASMSADGTTVYFTVEDPAFEPSLTTTRNALYRIVGLKGARQLVQIADNIRAGSTSRSGTVATATSPSTSWLITSTGSTELPGHQLLQVTPSGQFALTFRDDNGTPALYRRDVASGTEVLAATKADGTPASIGDADLSDDGSAVAFFSPTDDVVPGTAHGLHTYVRRIDAGITNLVCCDLDSPSRSSSAPNIDDNGDRVVFLSWQPLDPADTNGFTDVFVWDRPAQTFSVSSASVSEAAGAATITVSVDTPSSAPIDLKWTAEGTWSDSDITGPGGTFTLPANASSTTFNIPIVNDTLYEHDESYSFRVSFVDHPAPGVVVGTVHIADDDAAYKPRADILKATADESTGVMTFTVKLNRASGVDTVIGWETRTNTAASPQNQATEGSDYNAGSGQVTVRAGQTTGTFTVTLINDSLPELDESFVAWMTSATDATAGYSNIGVILDDETAAVRDVTS